MSRPAPSADPHNRRTVLLLCLGLALLTLAVFGQTFRDEFVNYDDNLYVYQNPNVVAGLTQPGLVAAFSHAQYDNWVPLTTISHMLDVELFGLNAGAHHLINVVLHTASVLLLFLVLRRMTGALWPSASVAAVFAVHPLHVESVAWISERKDMLSGFFFMLTLWAYVRYAHLQLEGGISADKTDAAEKIQRSRLAYFFVLFFFACGLMAKPMLVTLPFVLLLLDYWPLNRFTPAVASQTGKSIGGFQNLPLPMRLVIEKIPLLALSLGSCLVTAYAQTATLQFLSVPLPIRLENVVVSYATYIIQTFFPVGLGAFYPYPIDGLPFWKVLAAGALLALVSAWTLSERRRRPYLLVGWLWYLGMLVPVIGFVQEGAQARADRHIYLSQIGLCLMLTWFIVDTVGRWRIPRPLLGGLSAVIVLALAVLAGIQTSYWKNSITMWTHTLSVTSDNALARYNLGVAFTQEGRTADAIQNYEETVKLSPDYVAALNNLAWLLATAPQPWLRNGPQAVVYAERACEVTHYQVPFVMTTLAAAYAEAGRFPDAIATAQKVQTLATQNGSTAFARQIGQLIRMFQAHQAYHERSLHKTSP